jgi:hypothetical protein
MQLIRVFVLTCNKYLWALRPFSYLFNQYWSSLQPVVVGCFAPPSFPLPDNFTIYQIDKQDYPANKWSNGLIKMLKAVNDEFVVLLLEDYWLCRGVDHSGILTLRDYMIGHGNVVRFDLTADRLYGHMMRDVDYWGHYDIIECAEDAPYQMSLQAAIWRRELLLWLLQPDKSAWEVELHTNMVGRDVRVLGSRQYPIRYSNAVYQGKIDRGQIGNIPMPHRGVIDQWIPGEMESR